MDKLKLEASYRSNTSKGRTKQLRREGFVTANVFGHDSESVAIEVKLQDLLDQIKSSETGVHSLIDLKIKGSPKKADGMVVIKDVLKDPLTRKLLNVGFQRVSMKEKIHVGVPIELVGDAPGAKFGGMLEQMLDELQVSCLPGNIPAKIVVDVSGLEMGSMIRVDELALPDGVEVLADPETLVANCRPPHVAVETEEVEVAAESSTAGASTESKASE
ncbi:MAG: 50S ribosomal protein L25 [Armatimonadota bacterium]|nr:50S ribosomal protein L25 [bacterium]